MKNNESYERIRTNTNVYERYQYNTTQYKTIQNNTIIGRSSGSKIHFECASVFNSYSDSEPKGIISLHEWLTTSTYKEKVEEVRRCLSPRERRQLKSKLPAITPSGIFSKRKNNGLIKHSGIICIDIDGKENNINDWEALKDSLSDMQGLYYAGLSVSGNGIFMLFRITTPSKHEDHFNALEEDFKERGIVIDAQCKDISRLRGASYDENPYFNINVNPYGKTKSRASENKRESATFSNSDITAYRVLLLVSQIASNCVDMTENYEDWYAIGQSLANEFGESGRDLFHRVSKVSPKYKQFECDYQYDKCLQNCEKKRISTFFWYCKRYGLTTK